MIKRHIGLLRNLVHKRKEIIAAVKQVLNEENILVISFTDSVVKVSGHSNNTSTSLFMLGKAIATAWPTAQAEDPNVQLTDFLQQPINIAFSHIEHEGQI